ncbi:expressed unknown protein [Seminavis robusta]|uniref:Uncharacterized protein n=1 Tax=Seminavis robusta TaxID=568900 RepID=A0A9N8HVD8_9STRA|nr:expressed unknown protein [Seminavis robusta]|eukprot:Sro1788_g297570.1 n/a (505) ;mRNA; r:1254-2768
MESNNEGKEDALPVPPDLKDAKNSPKRAGKDVANFLFQTERGLSFLEESNPTINSIPSVDETTQNDISSPISSNKENHGSSTSVKSPSNNNKKKRTPWLTLSPSSRRKTKQAPAIPQESAPPPPPTKRKQPREVIEIITVAEGIEAVKMAEQRDFSRTFSFEVMEDLSEGDATPTTNNNSSNSRLQTTTEEEGVEVERRNPFEDPELIQKYQHTSTTTTQEEEHNNSDKPKWWKKAPQIVLSPFRKNNKKKTDETTRGTPAEEEDAPTTNHFVLESAPEPKHIVEEEEEEEEAKEEIQQEVRVEEMFPFHHQTDNDTTIPQKAMVMMMDDSDTEYHATTTQTTANSPSTTTTQKQWIASVALSSILVCLLTLRYIPTFDTLCGPVMHGTTLDLTNLHVQSEQQQSLLQAPWWGGNEQVFSLVCGVQRPRIQLEWKPHTQKTGRLVLTDLDDAKKTNVLLDKKNLVSVEIGLSGGTSSSSSSSSSKPIITAIDKGGKSHVLPAPW